MGDERAGESPSTYLPRYFQSKIFLFLFHFYFISFNERLNYLIVSIIFGVSESESESEVDFWPTATARLGDVR